MKLFGNDTDLAILVGGLQARVEALEATVKTLQAAPAVNIPAPVLPSRVATIIRNLANKDQALARHLMDEATGMLALGMDEEGVCASLVNGSPARY